MESFVFIKLDPDCSDFNIVIEVSRDYDPDLINDYHILWRRTIDDGSFNASDEFAIHAFHGRYQLSFVSFLDNNDIGARSLDYYVQE